VMTPELDDESVEENEDEDIEKQRASTNDEDGSGRPKRSLTQVVFPTFTSWRECVRSPRSASFESDLLVGMPT